MLRSSTFRTAARRLQHVRSCGFLAAIGTSDNQNGLLHSRDVLDQATARLQHRGPDGRHLAQGMTSNNTTRWSMGHQRLAIVDPDSRSADMPFVLEFGDGKKLKLVANGEIYNHKALYEELCNDHGWTHARQSQSDCEVIAHACACLGPEQAVKKLDGMFAFCLFTENEHGDMDIFAARDPVGIKPLYHATDNSTHVLSSELKALVGHVDPSTVQAIPAGQYWTPESGCVRYHTPAWLYGNDDDMHRPTDDEIRHAFTQAVQKRMMADVDYGFLLSGGVDSCILSHALLPMVRQENGDDRPIPAFTVGMEDSPDLQAAKAMVDALGGERYVDHRPRIFTGTDVFDLIPKIIYHMETYEAELIRSAIPNWLLAERAGADVKMVLTGEGADELFAGYLYFMHATEPSQVQNELKRIYQMLGNINLHRTDRMTMAHGLEARVPFLDTQFTDLAMRLDPRLKMVDPDAVKNNTEGREKSFLRKLFEGENENGHSIPKPVLWRAKAMQCEGVGEDWVGQLQRRVASGISDAELAECAALYPLNTPQTKEELFYRRIFEDNFSGMAHVVNAWEGGCRAAGASWESKSYTREGLVDTNVLTHAFQNKKVATARTFATRAADQPLREQPDEAVQRALDCGYDSFQGYLTSGGDDRSLIHPTTQRNKYHVQPQPKTANTIFRGSCTCNAPTELGYDAARMLHAEISNSPNAEETIDGIFQEQRERIASLLHLPAGSEVILVPSGSDAEYLPIAIARALAPKAQKKIANVVTQYNEIGAGTAPASGGTYFSTHVPLLGQLAEGSKRLAGFENVSAITIPARRAEDGKVLPASQTALDIAAEEETKNGAYTIVHGVYSGKTGLLDETMPSSRENGRESLAVIDGCQGRFNTDQLREWLEDHHAIVLFTGSKFYQAPPFCGAVIIPSSIAQQLRELPPPEPREMFGTDGLGGFLSDKELPDCMKAWKPLLAQNNTDPNVGLALRWEAGLAEMQSLATVPASDIHEASEEWKSQVCKLVDAEEANSDSIDLFCANSSIVSIRVKESGGGGWLGMDDLREVYRLMSMDLSSFAPEEVVVSAEDRDILASPVSMGQPVSIAQEFGIVRLALGSESLRSFLQDKTATLEEDRVAVRKLAIVAKYYAHFKNC